MFGMYDTRSVGTRVEEGVYGETSYVSRLLGTKRGRMKSVDGTPHAPSPSPSRFPTSDRLGLLITVHNRLFVLHTPRNLLCIVPT